MRRVSQSLPDVFSEDLYDYEILGHNVGIRPYRSSGMRIEKEFKDGQKIVHAYGKSRRDWDATRIMKLWQGVGINGGGYIFGFGVARETVKLVDEFLFPNGKARL